MKNIKSQKNRPELSSPTTNTFASFFLKPSAETNLSRKPMRRTKMSKQFSFNFLGCFSREGGLLMFFSLCSSATPRDDDDYCCGELFQDKQILLSIRRFYDQFILFDHQLLHDQN